MGVRLVRTHESSTSNLPADLYPDQTPQGVSNLNGEFVPVTTEHTFTNVLPSANLRFDVTKDLVARASMARVMSRPDYGALVSAVENARIVGTLARVDGSPSRVLQPLPMGERILLGVAASPERGYRMRALVKAIVTSSRYREGNDRK